MLLALSSPVVCILTVLRFRSPNLRFPMLFATLVFAMSGAPSAGHKSSPGFVIVEGVVRCQQSGP